VVKDCEWGYITDEFVPLLAPENMKDRMWNAHKTADCTVVEVCGKKLSIMMCAEHRTHRDVHCCIKTLADILLLVVQVSLCVAFQLL
jgi:hypothetical protein